MASALKNVAENVASLCVSMSQSLNVTLAEKKLSISKQQTELKQHSSNIVGVLENSKKLPKLYPLRRELKSISNTLSGLQDGLADKELSVSEYKRFLRKVIGKLDIVQASCSDVLAKIEEQKQVEIKQEQPETYFNLKASTKDGKLSKTDVLKMYRDEYEKAFKTKEKEASESNDEIDEEQAKREEKELLTDEEAKEKLEQYRSKYRQAIPKRVEYFNIVRVPVVPIFKDRTLSKAVNFVKAGIRYVRLGPSVTVLEDQIILVVSKRALAGLSKPFPKTKKAQDRLNSEYDKIVYDLVDTINARSTVKYDVVSKKYQLHESNNDLLLVWLMPQKQLTKLRQLSSNKRGIELESWDFPWR